MSINNTKFENKLNLSHINLIGHSRAGGIVTISPKKIIV